MNARLTMKPKDSTLLAPGKNGRRNGLLQRYAADERESGAVPAVDSSTREFTESRFGYDFSRVPARAVESTQSCSVSPRRCPFGGVCHTCPVHLQTKLTVNKPGDRCEQEADRIAEQVMRMPEQDVEPVEMVGTENGTQWHDHPAEEYKFGRASLPATEGQVIRRKLDGNQDQASPEALRAASHATAMLNQTQPRIWFDSWYNDGRDNNDNGKYDEDDREEKATIGNDGAHYRSGSTWPKGARIRRGIWPISSEEHVVPNGIMYKVCVDVVNESYRSAGINLGTRSVAGLESRCRRSRRFRTWREDRGEKYPDLFPGDIITYKTDGHSHSGIVGTNKEIVHLPGPSNWFYFSNSSKNDMESTGQWVWRSLFGITQVARLGSRRKRAERGSPIRRLSRDNFECAVAPPIVEAVLSAPGKPLESTTRRSMETTLGHDFSQVRVHTDTAAAESARSVNASAYAVGRDVVFAAGQYAPETRAGRRLLAHELVHVVQQDRASTDSRIGESANNADNRVSLGQSSKSDLVGGSRHGLHRQAAGSRKEDERKKRGKTGKQQTVKEPKPTAHQAKAQPVPSRLPIPWLSTGAFSLGLRLGFPGLPESSASLQKALAGSPNTIKESLRRAKILDHILTGKVPSGWEEVDKSELVKYIWGIFSQNIAPDLAARITRGLTTSAGPGGLSYELDLVLITDFDKEIGGGLSFTVHW